MTSTIKVNNIQNQCGANIINENSNTITLGASGDTIALASGASQTGFGRTGTVDWQTGSIKTATFTAANGEGYFANTSGGAFTMNLPAGTAGNIVSVVDYTNTFQTHNLTISPNGSQKIGGINAITKLFTEGQSVTFVYVDDIEGWKNVQDSTSNKIGGTFVTATGGTISECGDCKIHTFTGPGTFCVSGIATTPANNEVSYLVVAGAGGGGDGKPASGHPGGGGGAGGFRETKSPVTPYTASPLDGQPSAPNRITVTAAAFPITVGAGGAAGTSTGSKGGCGNNSIFSTITAALGGGGGAGQDPGSNRAGNPGGSGGGSGSSNSPPAAGGCGNTPSVTPPQGNPGGPGAQTTGLGGSGGGATAAGTRTSGPPNPGGAGAATSITGSPVTYSTGGANPSSGCGPAGAANTGNGGDSGINADGGAGGSGIVVIRYKFQ